MAASVGGSGAAGAAAAAAAPSASVWQSRTYVADCRRSEWAEQDREIGDGLVFW